jgi:predicted MFS family arabinose efflux permease
VSLVGSANLAAPLYAGYAQRFGFSSVVLTLIFATYTLVLVPSLLVFGQLSDRLGRRPVVVGAMGVGIVGLVLFSVADSVAWLFAARIAQGFAVAMITGAGTAALVEIEPHGDARRAALVATVALTCGTGTGPLVAGTLAEWAPAPRLLCFLVGIAALSILALATLAIEEPAHSRREGWRVQRPNVPAEIRAAFVRAALTAAAVWSVAALFVSVLPSYASDVANTSNLAALGATASVMLFASAASQLAIRGRALGPGAQAAGLGLLAIGLLGLVLASPFGTLAVLIAGAVLAGVGHGVGFLAAQGEVNRIAPDESRGDVTAAFFTCVYLGVSVSVIGVGALADATSLFTAVEVFAGLTGGAALLVAAWHLGAERVSPAEARSGAARSPGPTGAAASRRPRGSRRRDTSARR